MEEALLNNKNNDERDDDDDDDDDEEAADMEAFEESGMLENDEVNVNQSYSFCTIQIIKNKVKILSTRV